MSACQYCAAIELCSVRKVSRQVQRISSLFFPVTGEFKREPVLRLMLGLRRGQFKPCSMLITVISDEIYLGRFRTELKSSN